MKASCWDIAQQHGPPDIRMAAVGADNGDPRVDTRAMTPFPFIGGDGGVYVCVVVHVCAGSHGVHVCDALSILLFETGSLVDLAGRLK